MLTSRGQGNYFANRAQQFQNRLGVWRPGLNGVKMACFDLKQGQDSEN